jgi:hypothetical protein
VSITIAISSPSGRTDDDLPAELLDSRRTGGYVRDVDEQLHQRMSFIPDGPDPARDPAIRPRVDRAIAHRIVGIHPPAEQSAVKGRERVGVPCEYLPLRHRVAHESGLRRR